MEHHHAHRTGVGNRRRPNFRITLPGVKAPRWHLSLSVKKCAAGGDRAALRRAA